MTRINMNNHSDDMSVDELIGKIYEFEGNAEEWLKFEKEVREAIKHFSGEENEVFIESEAMESLTMVCVGLLDTCESRPEAEAKSTQAYADSAITNRYDGIVNRLITSLDIQECI